MIERVADILLNLGVGAFGALWMAIIVSAAATLPIVGFAVAIPAGLVVYVVRATATGQAEARLERLAR